MDKSPEIAPKYRIRQTPLSQTVLRPATDPLSAPHFLSSPPPLLHHLHLSCSITYTSVIDLTLSSPAMEADLDLWYTDESNFLGSAPVTGRLS